VATTPPRNTLLTFTDPFTFLLRRVTFLAMTFYSLVNKFLRFSSLHGVTYHRTVVVFALGMGFRSFHLSGSLTGGFAGWSHRSSGALLGGFDRLRHAP